MKTPVVFVYSHQLFTGKQQAEMAARGIVDASFDSLIHHNKENRHAHAVSV